MSGIPIDIMATATEVSKRTHSSGGDRDILAIAEAIKAERLRCSKTVGDFATAFQNQSDDTDDETTRQVFYRLACICAEIQIAVGPVGLPHSQAPSPNTPTPERETR